MALPFRPTCHLLVLLLAYTYALRPAVSAHVYHGRTAGVRCALGRQSLQVITDIDDTIKSSGGVAILPGVAGTYLGGVDTSYSRGTFYPGVFQFGLELSCAG